MPSWTPHLDRARQMGFNWVFVNPFHLPGFSGSLYSVKDYYSFHPLLVDPQGAPPEAQLGKAIEHCHALGMEFMMDLVINHTAVDSPLVSKHPEWYQRGSQGEVLNPGAYRNGQWIRWGDLAAVENAASPDRDNLWQYWLRLVRHYADLGVDGFRCDAAYQVPADLWRFLIESARREFPRLRFFAETLGCTPDQTLEVAGTGFDFIFNSSKYWDFSAPWCLDQYRLTSPVVPSVSFPESHDTERLAAELNGDHAAVQQRYVFAALFSTGVMISIGFEFGFRRRLHVVNTRAEQWESPNWDDTQSIRRANDFKARHRVWNEEGPTESLDVGNPDILALLKSTRDGAHRALLVLNKDRFQSQSCSLASAIKLLGEGVLQVSPQFVEHSAADRDALSIPPAGLQIFLSGGS